MPSPISTICLPPDAALPLRSAASALHRDLGTALVAPGAAADLTVYAPNAATLPAALAQLLPAPGDRPADWHAIATVGGAMHVTGTSPRAIAHAMLALRDAAMTGADVRTARDGFHAAALDERLVTWDQLCNQTSRHCRTFDRARHFEEACRIGLTSVEINRSPDQDVYQVTHLRRPEDPYPWVNDYGLALDMYAESDLNRGTYPRDMLDRHRADLAQAAAEAAKWGLVPSMTCYEPRWVPELFFQHHPRLRGTRVDHPGRSYEPRYTLDIAQPIVLDHYRQLLAAVFGLVPDLGYLHLWHVDSGCGYPFSAHLYPGPNGSQWAKTKPFARIVADFLGALVEQGRSHNPRLRVIQANTWEFTRPEWEAVLAELPDGAEVSHSVGIDEWRPLRDKEVYSYGGLAGACVSAGNTAELAQLARARGREPYFELAVSHARDLEPCVGTDFPDLLVRKLATLRSLGAKRFMCRFGYTSPPIVSRAINHEVMRDAFFGHTDPTATIADRAAAWSSRSDEADAIRAAWSTLSSAIASIPTSTWFAPGWAMSWGQWLFRPLVPDRTRLSEEELDELTTHEFYLDNDPGRVNVFFEGYERIMREDDSEWFVAVMDEDVLAPLDRAAARLAALANPSAYTTELHDRIEAHRRLIGCYRNWFAGQRLINLALIEHREDPSRSPHLLALRRTIQAEIENLDALADLIDRSPHVLLLETRRARNVYRHAQIARLLRKKTAVMRDHVNDPPGPFVPQLLSARQRLSRPRAPAAGRFTSMEHLAFADTPRARAPESAS